ncbi:MAG: cyclic nucleotide-binding domain-containing protein [Deltaproteobacteria bacterium]|nr:MAG: cyclic nucleotide-binding domain-containing protein [Deltaproteobacteria bacterium]TNF30599.1 MAG: cyclic nucleotide-binding domain-containing protein [Deltaproteobacteria bacterium]
MSVAELVKGCPLFHEIYDNEVEEILSSCVVASYEKNDAIINQGDTSSDICILLAGTAGIYVNKDGHRHFITDIGSGDLFGELVLINETERTADIVAKERCDVLIISYEDFYSFYHKRPKVFALMVLNVTRLITKRLKGSNSIIEGLNTKLRSLEEKKAA